MNMNKRILRRLQALISSVQMTEISLSRMQYNPEPYCIYAVDSSIVQEISRRVLCGYLAPDPHPEYGDDGYQEHVQEEALNALQWGEEWVQWRRQNDWGDRIVCEVGSPLKDSE